MRRKFIAAKVNINEGIFNPDIHHLISLIPQIIMSYPEFSSKKSSWVWCFGELKKDKHNICGNFVKKRNEKKLVYQGSKAEYHNIPNAAYQAFFLYNAQTEILIFEETGDMNRDEFINAFQRIIYEGHVEIGEISIQLIPIRDVMKSEISKIEVLTKIEFDLVHPNPISDGAYKDLDDIIKKEKATRLKTTLENKNGLNKEGPFIDSGIEMVSKGYGDVNAYGFSRVQTFGKRKRMRNVPQKFKSRDAVQMTYAEKEVSKEKLFQHLVEFAQKVKNLLL